LLKQVESHQTTTIMSTYDMLVEEGRKEEKKKVALKQILSISTSLQNNIAIEIIAIVLSLPPIYVKNIQKELQKESEILQLLKDKLTIQQIAKQLKVSELVVEALHKTDSHIT